MTRIAPLAMLTALAAGPVAAHPHVFVDGEIGFEVDAAGRLAAMRVVWRFDAFYTMLLMIELELDPAAPPDAAALAALAALQPEWAQDFGGDGVLRVQGQAVPLAPAQDVTAAVEDGRLVMAFARPLAAPLAARGVEIEASLYDPLFFVAYMVEAAPTVAGPGAAACAARLHPFDPTDELRGLQDTLLGLAMEETPADPEVGRLLADRATLTCG